jgi:hypothetical protein
MKETWRREVDIIVGDERRRERKEKARHETEIQHPFSTNKLFETMK